MTIGQVDGAAERGPAIADVAARAGVSHQTVSRVLNGHPNVAAATKNRVLTAIAELGDRRNLSARVLATGRSNVVGVVAQNTTLFGPSSMVEPLGPAAVAADLSLTVGHGGDETASFQRSVERLIEQGAAGLVFIAPVDTAAAAGYAAGRVLAQIPGCGAAFAANDHTALGIRRAMAERGRPVPGDVSLVGFDDVPESGFFTPPLTTVRQEFGEVGRAALRLLLDQLTSGERSTDSILVEPILVPRQTVGAAAPTLHSGRPHATGQEHRDG